MATVELGEVGAGVVAAAAGDDRHVQFDVLAVLCTVWINSWWLLVVECVMYV